MSICLVQGGSEVWVNAQIYSTHMHAQWCMYVQTYSMSLHMHLKGKCSDIKIWSKYNIQYVWCQYFKKKNLFAVCQCLCISKYNVTTHMHIHTHMNSNIVFDVLWPSLSFLRLWQYQITHSPAHTLSIWLKRKSFLCKCATFVGVFYFITKFHGITWARLQSTSAKSVEWGVHQMTHICISVSLSEPLARSLKLASGH